MSIERDPKQRNSWLFELGERQYDYESYLGIVESGRLGHVDKPSHTHDEYNEAMKLAELKTNAAYGWLVGNGVDFEVSTNPLIIGMDKTARIIITDEDDAKRFTDYMEENPQY